MLHKTSIWQAQLRCKRRARPRSIAAVPEQHGSECLAIQLGRDRVAMVDVCTQNHDAVDKLTISESVNRPSGREECVANHN